MARTCAESPSVCTTARPAVVMIGKGGQHGVIRRREDLDAVVRYEAVPDWL